MEERWGNTEKRREKRVAVDEMKKPSWQDVVTGRLYGGTEGVSDGRTEVNNAVNPIGSNPSSEPGHQRSDEKKASS